VHYTGHPIFDVGLATITAHSRKPDPAKLTEMDLEDVAAFIERYFTRPPFSTFLTITLMNSDFTQPAYQGDEERKRAYARLLARSLAPELHQSDEICAFTGLSTLSIPLSLTEKEAMSPGQAYRQHLPLVTFRTPQVGQSKDARQQALSNLHL
jgi:CRISPR-associated protein Cst1